MPAIPTSKFHSRIGAKGGSRKSRAKSRAGKLNGILGGRPSKIPDSTFRKAAAYVLNGGNINDAIKRFGVYHRKLMRFIIQARRAQG